MLIFYFYTMTAAAAMCHIVYLKNIRYACVTHQAFNTELLHLSQGAKELSCSST